jgi:hypothetical protein
MTAPKAMGEIRKIVKTALEKKSLEGVQDEGEVKVKGMEQEEVSVVVVGVRGDAGNELPEASFLIISHPKGSLSRYNLRIMGLSHGLRSLGLILLFAK